jgi:hypothetical protein
MGLNDKADEGQDKGAQSQGMTKPKNDKQRNDKVKE